MSHNTNVTPRKRYASALRDQQTDATRTRILEALVRTMTNGVAGLSMPAVAREAGVSIPTIYRHFGSKQGLVQALYPYVAAKSGLVPDRLPETFADLDQMVRQMFRRLAGMDQTLRAAMASELGQQARQAAMSERRATARQILGGLARDLPDPELDRLAAVFLILMSAPVFQALKDYLQLGPGSGAELVSWAMRALIDGTRSRSLERKDATT